METTPISPLRTFCWGILHAIGMFELADLTNAEKAGDLAGFRTYFSLGETCMVSKVVRILRVARPERGEEQSSST